MGTNRSGQPEKMSYKTCIDVNVVVINYYQLIYEAVKC